MYPYIWVILPFGTVAPWMLTGTLLILMKSSAPHMENVSASHVSLVTALVDSAYGSLVPAAVGL